MTIDEIKRLLSGPLSAYMMTDGCSYGRFIELLNSEFPELKIAYGDLYPILFNLEAKIYEDFDTLYYDINSVGREYLSRSKKTCLNDYLESNNSDLKEIFDNVNGK